MKKFISKFAVKFISMSLAFAILFECNAPVFAAVKNENRSSSEELSDFAADNGVLNNFDERLSELYQAGQEGNSYEVALNRDIKKELNNLENSSDRKKIDSLKHTGKDKYGNLWPMYVSVTGSKNVSVLEKSLLKFLTEYFAPLEVMPFDKFKNAYNQSVKDSAKAYVSKFWNKNQSYTPFKSPEDAVEAAIKESWPLKQSYDSYVKEAKAEIAWRKANENKIEEGGYQVIRAYVKAINPEVLSPIVLNNLINLELNGKKAITDQEVLSIRNYTVARIEKQNLDALSLNIISNDKDKKVAARLLQDIIETIVVGGYTVNQPGTYSKAVENIIYRSENTAGFNHILSAGFASLLAVKDYDAIRRILRHYTVKENEGADWGDYISLSFYADRIHNSNGKYLGKSSELTQYTTKYSYENTFTDLAELLAEDGSGEALKILNEYTVDLGLKAAIKPFFYGALKSGKSLPVNAATALATDLINLSMGDIPATQEYIIDKSLFSKYKITKYSKDNAIINESKLRDRQSEQKTFGYFHRAAVSGDILILIWGAIGLVKIGGKAMALGRSAYTAVKAGRITNTAKKVAYIRANYAKMSRYISVRNSFQAMKLKAQAGQLRLLGKVEEAKTLTSSRTALKIDARSNQTQLGRLGQIRERAVTDLQNTANPTARQAARADLADAQFRAKQTQIDFLRKARMYKTGFDAKNAVYTAEVEAYNANVAKYNALLSGLNGANPAEAAKINSELAYLRSVLDITPSVPAYTAGELSYVNASNAFNSALNNFNSARTAFKQTGWWYRNIISPWKAAPAGDGTLGLWKLETDPGITLAQALKINRPYNPDYTSGVRLFSNTGGETGNVNKFYNFLDAHHLKPITSGLKFINNKATLFGFSLLFNYNVATVNPWALEGGRAASFATELVADGSKTLESAKLFKMLGGTFPLSSLPNAVKPVNIVDPKFLQFYKAVPLPAGNIISDFSPKALFATTGKLTGLTGAAFAMPIMFGRDLLSAYSNAFLKTPVVAKVKPWTLNNLQLNENIGYNAGVEPWTLFNGHFGQTPKYFYEIPAVSRGAADIDAEDVLPSYITREYSSSVAITPQIARERKALNNAWNTVENDWHGGANAVIAEMEMEGLSFEVRHGYAIEDEETGEVIVQGPVLRRQTGNFSNFGLTKIIYKHGIAGGRNLQYAGSKYVTKEDFAALPFIIRNFEPEILDNNKTLRYVIQDDDGQALIVVFKAKSKRRFNLITMYYKQTVTDGLKISGQLTGTLSKKLGLKPRFAKEDTVSRTIVLEDEVVTDAAVVSADTDLKNRAFTMSVINADGSEVMLPVNLSFNENFKTRGYSNVVFNKGVAELRQFEKEPRVMSNFFIVLKNQNKSFKHFVDALKASGQSITVKFFQYGIKPRKTITTTLYNADGTSALPVKVITDPNFLKEGSKLVLTPSGRIGVLAAKGYMPDLIDDTAVLRIPKNQTETFLKLLPLTAKPLPIEIMPNYNKANVIIEEGFYINPSLGKTLGPVLPQSLGVSEEFATNLMYIVNYMPGLLSPLLNPLIKKFGEVAVFKFSILMSSVAALLPVFFGFYGYSSQIEPTTIRSISLGIALFALAFSINVRNVVGNSLINMNRGAMPIAKEKKAEEKTVTEAAKITTDILWEKTKKLFSNGTDFSMEDILFYNRSFINKNLGTMAFLIAPSILNYGGSLFGLDLNLGWDVALPLYAAYSAYAGWKVHNTNLRDKKIIEDIKTDMYQISAEDTPAIVQKSKKSFSESLNEIWDTAVNKDGVLNISTAMALATAHELSVSSAFSSTLYQIIPDGDMATIMVIGILYGSLMAGRLLGNVTATRMSAGTSYLGYSGLSLGGTAAIAAGIMGDMSWLVLTGGVIASIGIGNYFSQMFAYIIRKHPDLQSQISQVLSFTMPIAVGLSMPITYLNDWFGVPYARVMAAFAMLVGSLVMTKDMMESSTLYKYIVQEFKEASDYVVGVFNKKPVTDAGENGSEDINGPDINNAQPQN